MSTVSQALAERVVHTDGGAYIHGDTQVDHGDFVGRDKYNYQGPITQQIFFDSPKQFAALFANLTNVIQTTPMAHAILLATKNNLERTRHHIRRVIEYKDTHDLLQQLEQAYQVTYELIYEHDLLLTIERINWRGLGRSTIAMQTTILRLVSYVMASLFAEDFVDWLHDLEQANVVLPKAFEQNDLVLVDTSMQIVYGVISRQSSRINDRLIGSIDELDLGHLAATLRHVCQELASVKLSPSTQIINYLKNIEETLDVLTQFAERVTALRNDHDSWQQLDAILRSEQELLNLNLNRFRMRWNLSLRHKILAVYHVANTRWAAEMEKIIEKVDNSLVVAAHGEVIEIYFHCRSTVMLHFVQVDYDLKFLCGILKETGGPLDSLVDSLA